MNGRTIQWMAAGCIGVTLFLVFVPAIGNLSQAAAAVDPSLEADILKSTVQIRLLVPVPGADPVKGGQLCDMEQGLGSVVRWQGVTVIVTHNHWGHMMNDAQYAHILDAQGAVLRQMWMDEFKSLIRYSDAGTLILDIPAGLSITPSNLSIERNVPDGDTVTMVHQDPKDINRVAALQAKVISHKIDQGQPVFELKVLGSGKIIKGDSGGGIWYQGKLVGNSWSTITKTWQFSVTAQTTIAAQLPVSLSPENPEAQTLDRYQE